MTGTDARRERLLAALRQRLAEAEGELQQAAAAPDRRVVAEAKYRTLIEVLNLVEELW